MNMVFRLSDASVEAISKTYHISQWELYMLDTKTISIIYKIDEKELNRIVAICNENELEEEWELER